MWPVPLSKFENHVIEPKQDMELNHNIHKFWEWALTHLPESMPRIKAKVPNTVLKTLEKTEQEEEFVKEYMEGKKLS